MKSDEIVSFDEKTGTLKVDLTTNGADIDWIRAARLRKKAAAGDKGAARELERVEKVEVVPCEE